MRHDVSSILSAGAMAVIALGVVVGYQFATLRTELSSRFSDAADQCTYKAIAEVHKDIQGNILSTNELGTVEIINNRNQLLKLNEGGLARASYANERMVFDPKRRTNYAENDKASITLRKLDQKVWAIKGIFCDQAPGSVRGCPTDEAIAQINKDIAAKSRSGTVVPDFRVNCGVDVVYGWVLERRTAPTPKPTSTPRLTATPKPTGVVNPSATPIVAGRGGMEVQVVALNYPNRTPLWPGDHVANRKPASCLRQGATDDARPLYLNAFEVRATCIEGGCRKNAQSTARAEKRQGYVNFYNLDAGTYKLEIRGLNKGYHMWPGCSGTWRVNANEHTQAPVIILENETKGLYELRSTEQLCKDAKGIPHILEGLGGNACYFANGQPDKPTNAPQPSPQPSPQPEQLCKAVNQKCEDHYRETCFVGSQEGTMLCHKYGSCTGIGNGTQCSWGAGSYCESCVPKSGIVPTTPIGGTAVLKVGVRVDSPAIKKVTVQLEPCPATGPCQQEVAFSSPTTKQIQFNVTPTNIRYRVKIVNRELIFAQALDGVRVKAERCQAPQSALIRIMKYVLRRLLPICLCV
ncbi:MAG: hypothetical protein UZ22_OP11002000513 [Microgenomates bacterium OLB23]|nr:MAG: hypothetical protein UZ22_OP11002000513 [Microgenomates bacterium OLB23]